MPQIFEDRILFNYDDLKEEKDFGSLLADGRLNKIEIEKFFQNVNRILKECGYNSFCDRLYKLFLLLAAILLISILLIEEHISIFMIITFELIAILVCIFAVKNIRNARRAREKIRAYLRSDEAIIFSEKGVYWNVRDDISPLVLELYWVNKSAQENRNETINTDVNLEMTKSLLLNE